VDWLLRAGRYDSLALVDESSRGRYWRKGGIFLPGIAAQLLGMVAAAMWIDSAAFVGPLSSASGGADFSVFAGVAVAGLAYWVLARRALRRENQILKSAAEPSTKLFTAVSK